MTFLEGVLAVVAGAIMCVIVFFCDAAYTTSNQVNRIEHKLDELLKREVR